MGLLSARGLRQIAIGAGESYLDKRQEMRDKIEEFRTRAADKKETLQKEYNAYYKEEKGNMQTFKNIATIVGENYTDQLNSFVMSGGDLNSLSQLDSNGIVDKLSTQKPVEGQVSYLDKVSEDIKLKNEEVNQSLQDQVGLYKGTSTLFTRGIEERGIKDIQADVGTISAGDPIDTKFSAGKSIEKSNLTNKDITDITKGFDDLYYKEIAQDEYEYDTEDPKVIEIFNKSKILQENAKLQGIEINDITARAEILYSQQYDWYKGDNLQYLTPQSINSPEVKSIIEEFDNNISGETDLSELQTYVDKVLPLNKYAAEMLQNKLKEEIAEREQKTNTDDTVTVEDVVPKRPDLKGIALGSKKRKEKQAEIEAWDSKYGNTHFDDGTLMTVTQQEAWKDSQSKKGGRSKRNIQQYVD